MDFGKKLVTLLDLCVSSLRRGHANLLCIVPILTDDLLGGSTDHEAAGESLLSVTLRSDTSAFPGWAISAWSVIRGCMARLAQDLGHTFSAFWL